MSTAIDFAALDHLEATLPADTPIYVLNLLRFRDRAECPQGVTPVGGSGREAYFNGYVPAFGAVAKAQGVAGVKPVWIGAVAAGVAVAPGELWDTVAIIEYPSVRDFRRVVDTDDYRARAEPMRQAALEEWRLIAQTRMELPA